MHNLLIVLSVFAFVFCGCSKEKKLPDQTGEKQVVLFSKLTNDAILITVDGKCLDKKGFAKLVDLRKKMYELRAPAGMKQQVDREMLENTMLGEMKAVYPMQCALARFAETNGLEVTEDDLADYRNKFKSNCGKEFIPWANFENSFSVDEKATMNERIRVEAIGGRVRKWFLEANPVKTDEKEVKLFQEKFADYNRRAALTNAVIWAHATNVWNHLQAGMSFEKAANKYTEDENHPENGEWGGFRLSDLADDGNLSDIVSKLKPGWYTPPVEGDNGLMILRLDSIEKQEGGNEERYNLSRVFFQLPEFREIVSDEVMRAELLKAKENAKFNSFVRKLVSGVNVTYPSGEKIFKMARMATRTPANVFGM